jgi:hypothetical protein
MIEKEEYLICSKCTERIKSGIGITFGCMVFDLGNTNYNSSIENFIFCSPRCAQEALSEKIHETAKGMGNGTTAGAALRSYKGGNHVE